jgi:outer membrane receptor for ferrienterochelin and colicins
MGVYDLPGAENFSFTFSLNGHDQNSVYGTTEYYADQKIAFGQMTWRKVLGKHDLLAGVAHRYTYYDDNTPATAKVSHTHLPGIFVQNEWNVTDRQIWLLGVRYDYHSVHGNIFSPRLSYKWSSRDEHTVVRLGLGNGYRVANIFTEDHAALTGSRDVVFEEDLKPETSWNGIPMGKGSVLEIDGSAFYTYFDNKIIPDYDTNVQQIIYGNLDGHAVSKGVSLNFNYANLNGIKASIGATLMDVYSEENGVRERQMLTERFMGTWTIGVPIKPIGVTVDYTGNLVGPMRLPVLGDTDPRPDVSQTWHLHNIQLSKRFGERAELFGGVKNLFNWTPNKDVPFLIARTNDPFDKEVQFDVDGNPVVSAGNPYGLTFDPAYVYAPNQGIRAFLGVRYQIF